MTFLPINGVMLQALRGSKIRGVQLAIVVDNKDGTDNPGYRVKVKFPWLNEQETSFWARIAVPMGGTGRGTYVLPEIDDQVLVVFEHGDINRPIVIGGLWSKKQEPVEVNQSGKNNTKLIKSRAGHRIIFDDKEGAEKITIVDKTKKNKIVLDSVNKIVRIESDGDIEVKAKTNIILHSNALKVGTKEGITGKAQSLLSHAQTTFGIKATNGITIGGGNVTINVSNAAATSVSGSGAGELGGGAAEQPAGPATPSNSGGNGGGPSLDPPVPPGPVPPGPVPPGPVPPTPLASTGALAVVVNDASNNSVVVNATVSLAGPVSPSAPTDASGTATFSAIPVGSYTITVAATNYQAATSSGTVLDSTSSVVNVSLTLLTGDLTVHVSNSSTSAAVPGATVDLSGPSPGAVITNASGDAPFAQLIPGSYTATVSATGFTGGTLAPTRVAPSTSTSASVTLTPLGALVVTVVDSAHHGGVAGVSVAIAGPTPGSATTDGAGRATFPNVQDGNYTLTGTKSGFQTAHGTVPVVSPTGGAATLSIVGIARLEVLDTSGNVATFVRFGLWDGAFTGAVAGTAFAATAPLNAADAPNNFVGSDSRFFSFRVTDPSATGNRVDIEWKAQFANGSDFTDTPATKTLTCMESPVGSKVFLSAPVMLVADHDDLQESTHSALPAGVPDGASVRAVGQSNHRLRRADMFSQVFARYPAPARSAVESTTPIFQRSPDERRKVALLIYILRGAVTASGATPSNTGVTPSADVFTELAQVRELYGRLGIWLWTATKPGIANAVSVTSGADVLQIVDPPPGVVTVDFNAPAGGGTPTVNQLATLYPGLPDTIRLFYVAALSTTARGWSWDDSNGTGSVLLGTTFLPGIQSTYNAAHEIGHHLTAKAPNGGHYKAPSPPGRTGEAPNLMRAGTSATTGARESKRIWNVSDGDSNNAFSAILGRRYVKP